MLSSGNTHVVILAGSEDTSLVTLTQALSGNAVPKQFALIAGNGSLLQQTLAAYAPLAPPERTTVVVSSEHEDLARTQLHEWAGITILARPRDRGPGLDLLLALGRVLARAPRATVIVTPADHYVSDPAPMVSALTAASAALSVTPVVLAGAAIDSLEQGRRFVIPGRHRKGRVHAVAGLVDLGTPRLGERVKSAAGLWHTSTFIAHAPHLWQAFQRKMPAATQVISELWAQARSPWGSIESACFEAPGGNREQPLIGTKGLGVVAVSGSGWNDWSSPERVMDSIRDDEELERLLARIFRRQRAVGAWAARKSKLVPATIVPRSGWMDHGYPTLSRMAS